MQLFTLHKLTCPDCQNDSDLNLQSATYHEEEIVSGSLICESCSANFPIKDSIPILFPASLLDKISNINNRSIV